MAKPKKCEMKECKIKLGYLHDIECKCGKYFCRKHRFFADHDCTYDYRAENMKKLTEQNPKIVRDKFEKI